MATLVGSLIAAIGAKMATSFPSYPIIYGLPATSGLNSDVDEIRIHYMQETGKFASSQLSGVTIVAPLISVTVQRTLSTVSTTLTAHQSLIDLGSDLRLAVSNLVMDHVTGVAPIAAFAGQALWVTDFVMTPSCLDIGAGQGTESVTAEFRFNFSRSYGGR